MSIPTVNVTVVVHGQDGNPVEGANVSAKLDREDRYNGLVVRKTVRGKTDASGVLVMGLFPNSLGTTGSLYQFTIQTREGVQRYEAQVPNYDCYLTSIIDLTPAPALSVAEALLKDANEARVKAELAADEAEGSAGAAATSASLSAVSASGASASSDSASGSASLASEKADAASASEIAAKASETASAASEAAAAASESVATAKAVESAASAAASATSASEAASSASGAASSASAASASEGNAALSAASAQSASDSSQAARDTAVAAKDTAVSAASTATTKASEAAASAAVYTTHVSTVATEAVSGHVTLSSTSPAALGTASKGTGTTVAKADHVHPTTGLMLTTHAANLITGFGAEPGAVSSSTSGAAGTATTVSRGDHSHDLGAHTHVDATTGGSLLSTTEPPAVSTSTSGAVGTATLLARADHGHDLGAHAHTGSTNGGQLDHGAALTGLGDDDHPQYSLANGSRAFTAAVSGVTPTADAHLATKAYVDSIVAVTDAMVFKGVIDCSASPNFPAADIGHTYRVSVAGKIGGASGINVEIGDMLICVTGGSIAGDLATVGVNWSVIQTNIDGAVVGPASVTSGRIATFSGTTGKLIADGGILATNLVRKDAASIIADNIKTYWGTGSDLALYHDGTNSYIDNITGSLYIRPVASETGILLAPNGAVTLYYDNAAKLATSSTGVTVTGTMAATTVTGANVTSGADPGHTHTVYVPKSLGTAKGDLIGFSASATASRVGVGTDGQVLTADSTAAAGIAWKNAPSSGMSEEQAVILSILFG